jgi:TRAP-type uncharacterized transport system fused permease subunit
MKLCSIAYIVPFLFVFSPSLLLIGHWYEVVLSVVTAIIGSILLGVGIVGYLFRPVGWLKRLLFGIAAVGLLIPVVHSGKFASLTWASNGIGLVLAVLLVAVEWLARGHAKTIATPGGVKAPAR